MPEISSETLRGPEKEERQDAPEPGRYAYEGLDRILHEKARLGLMTSLLSQPEGLLFNELKTLCSLTDGNLSRHIQVLHEAGLVEIWKGYENRRPQTLCRLSPEGRRRFVEYIGILRQVVEDATPEPGAAREVSRASDLPPGWVPVSG